jgi:cyclohexadieny/prephenate dehydrogenase
MLAEGLGSKTASLPPQRHDQLLALISHLPHMSAYALVDTALKLEKWQPLKYAAGGFRDFTRIAASSPQMWSEICLDNAVPLLKMIERFEKSLAKIKSLIVKGDGGGLIRFFESASEVRRKL